MTDDRKKEIVNNLKKIENDFAPTEYFQKITIFYLMSQYNKIHDNAEKIDGNWALENGFSHLNIY